MAPDAPASTRTYRINVLTVGGRSRDCLIRAARKAGPHHYAVPPGGCHPTIAQRAPASTVLVIHEGPYCCFHRPVVGRAEGLEKNLAVPFQADGSCQDSETILLGFLPQPLQ
jgi:hypothetical protein